MKSRPPKTRNWLTWSTSLVTRETSAPRRSVLWVSNGRSWTCRKALIRSVARPRSEVVKSREVMKYDAVLVTRIASPAASPIQIVNETSGPAVAVDAVVEGLLHRDRHHDLAGRGDHREGHRHPDAVLELRGEAHSASDRLDGPDVLAGVDLGGGHDRSPASTVSAPADSPSDSRACS